MNYFLIEWFKIKSRKWALILMVVTLVLMPVISRTLALLDLGSGHVSEGMFLEYAAYSLIRLSTLYFFIPLWILIFIGTEFTNGHVNLVVFHKSFRYYFVSKLSYCALVSISFSILSVFSIAIIQISAPFEIVSSFGFYLSFFIQSFITYVATSLMLMSIVFLTRSHIIGFVVFLFISFSEGIIFLLVKKLFSINFFFLPFHLTGLFYLRNGEAKSENYYNPFFEFNGQIIVLPIVLLIILFLTYQDFTRRDLKPLSD